MTTKRNDGDSPVREASKPREDEQSWMAREMLKPAPMSAMTISTFLGAGKGGMPDANYVIDALEDQAAAVAKGDLSQIEGMMLGQAVALQAMFTSLADRAAANLGKFPQAAESYARLALKAQAQSRATLEALAKMKQPREQTVRHIHVGPQGQAVFIENLHGGYANARIDGQPHACGTPLLGENAQGNGVPVPGNVERSMQDARRQIDGCAEGQSECVEAWREVGGNRQHEEGSA